MDFLELAKERYSCRSFTDKKVEKEKSDPSRSQAQYNPWKILKNLSQAHSQFHHSQSAPTS